MLSNENLANIAFANPQLYRDQLLKEKLITGNIDHFSGKSFICVSLTRFCPVGCKFCFFKSGPVFKKTTHEDIITPEGLEKFIQFANAINLGYLLVSGGGEPMMERKSIIEIIKKVRSERIVLVTSAHWAKTPESAQRYLDDICEALRARTTPTSLSIRVSVDKEHMATLTLNPIKNLINLFRETYKNIENLELQMHSLDGDSTIDELINIFQNSINIGRETIHQTRISDGQSAIKIVPRQEILDFDGFAIKVGYAKIFFSDLRVNIKDHLAIQKNIDVYQKDLFESEDGNSSIVTNKTGQPGLDFWVNYNGNVTTWGNQYLDNLMNLYVDSPSDIIASTMSDPGALSFLEKGANYRDAVVAEANFTAVIRSKAVNIRDYTGALMFDESRTRLYYTIRVLQDYINEKRIDQTRLNKVPEELQQLLKIDQSILVKAYKESSYTIVEETIEKGFSKDYVLDILEWIRLGHYELSDDKISKLIDFYNQNVDEPNKIENLAKLPHDLKMQIVRMTEHLTHIKAQARAEEFYPQQSFATAS